VCSYCQGESGALYPNGGWEQEAEGHEKGYHWIEGTKDRFYYQGPFGFEIAYELYHLKIWKFPNGEESREYLRLEESEAKNDEILYWLRSVPSIHLSSASTKKEIEYTPEIGMFFKSMVLYIWTINEKIRSMFGKDFDLEKIDINKIPMLVGNIGDEKND
jgi:hypothetical protein